jgi:ParB family chromosome partitioning protein
MAAAVAPVVPIMDQELIEVPIAKLTPAEDNLRRQIGDVDDLAQSIRALGIIEPLVASPAPGGRYDLIAGGCRV